MEVGKLNNYLLNELIFKNIKYKRDEVMVRPGIGEDCSVIDYGQYACDISSDPITGAVKGIGKLAINITCNDIASCGVEPLGIMLTILLPEGTTEEDINLIMKEAGEEAAKLKVEILGGHTEVTTSVNRVVISATAIGRQLKQNIVKTSGAKVGDKIIMTKTAGLEGTSIIAHDLEEELLSTFSREIIQRAKEMINDISVVKEGIVGGKLGASSMHDVTEGGILGALWEICEASKKGCKVWYELIPIAEETKKICEHFNINPLSLISSGSMIMTIKPTKAEKLIKALEEEGIKATIIGEITPQGKYLIVNNVYKEINPPESDELYKVI